MPDFSILQTPNFAQAALSGYQAGSALGKQKQIDAAMQNIDLERPETLLPVLRADPSTGAALIGASTKLAAQKHEDQSRIAQAALIKAHMGIGQGSPQPASAPTSVTTSVPTTAAGADQSVTTPSTPAAQGSDQADIVVTGSRAPPSVDMNAVQGAAIDSDPGGFLDIQSKLGTFDETRLKKVQAATGAMAAIGDDLLKLPYQQRRGYIQMHAADLAAHGVPPEKIQGFDPTDDNIHYEVGQARGVEKMAEQRNQDRAFQLQQQQFGETQNQHRIENGLSAQRVGLEAQSVGISGGHLALDRQKEAREAGKAAPGAVIPQYQYRIVNGVTQRKRIN